MYDGYTNAYSLVMNGKSITLKPLSPKDVCTLQKSMKASVTAYEKLKRECESAHEKEKVHEQKESCEKNNERCKPRVAKGEVKEGIRRMSVKK